MDRKIVWLDLALTDLHQIATYVAQGSPTHAQIVVRKLLAAAGELAVFPFIGSVVREWNDSNIRHRIVYSYRLIYQVKPDEVRVLAVIHGARLLDNEVRERADLPSSP